MSSRLRYLAAAAGRALTGALLAAGGVLLAVTAVQAQAPRTI